KLNLDGRVKFTGFLDLHAKKEAFVDASVVVVPSRSEVFTIAAIEALLCGTPILLSSACGINEIPSIAKAAAFFPSEDVGELALKLLEVLTDNRYAKAAKESQSIIGRTFSPESVGLQAEQIYTKVIRDLVKQ